MRLTRSVLVSSLATLVLLLASTTPAVAQTPEPPASPSRHWTFDWQRHPGVTWGNLLHIEARARFQFDRRSSDLPFPGTEDTWKVALHRVGVAGTVGRTVDFQVDRELVTDGVWRDVWIGWRPAPGWQVRAGQQKLPFGLDENTPLTTLDFVYRSQTSRQLAPGRDPGLTISGRATSVVRFDAGVFTHDGKNAARLNSTRVQAGATFAARVRVQPFRGTALPLRTLEAGGAVATGVVPEGVDALRGRTPIGLTFYSLDELVAGRRTRAGLELHWQPGPYSLNAEWIHLATARDGVGPGGTDLPDVSATGWYVSGAWVVTGQPKAAGLTPSRGVHQGGLGAIELAARLETLRFRAPLPTGDGVGNRDRIFTAGVTWVLNAWTRIQFNAIRGQLDRAIGGVAPPLTRFWGRVLRIQITI
jgi:phosphate-selective porin